MHRASARARSVIRATHWTGSGPSGTAPPKERPMSIAETATGPNHEGPAPGPWMVTSGKTDGITPGLQMKDSAGRLYFVKFDPPGYPDLGTGAEVISTKLLYAAGYHVPENYIVVIGREDLRIAPGATNHGPDGKKRPM